MEGFTHNKKHDIQSTTDHNGASGAVDGNIAQFNENGLPEESGLATATVTTHLADGTIHIKHTQSDIAPTSSYDSTQGYAYFSTHTQTNVNEDVIIWVCTDPTATLAIWKVIYGDGVDATVLTIHGKSGEAMTRGMVVYPVSPGQGDSPTFGIASNQAHQHIAGITNTTTTASGEDVEIIVFGEMDGLDTSGFSASGTTMHHITNGGWQEAKPDSGYDTHPGFIIKVGSGGSGIIFVSTDQIVHDLKAALGQDLIVGLGSTNEDNKVSYRDWLAVEFAKLTTGGLYIDTINEYTTDAGVTIDGVLIKDDKIDESFISVQKIGAATYDNLKQHNTLLNSSGLLTAGNVITDAGGGNIDIAARPALIRTSDSQTADLKSVNIPALNGQAILTDTARFIGVKYNSGSPIYTIETDDTWSETIDFRVGRVINEGGTLHVVDCAHVVNDFPIRMMHRMYEADVLKRADRIGGLIIGETGTRYITMSAGELYDCTNGHYIDAIDTSGSDTFDLYSSSGLVTAGATQWDNQNYDGGTLTNNWHANLWWYLEADGHLVCIYGTGQYVSSATAEAESPPSVLPLRVQVHGRLLGVFTFKKGAATMIGTFRSAFDEVFSGTLASDHLNLSNIGTNTHTQIDTHIGAANPHSGSAASGANSDITSLTGLTTALSTGQGGTGQDSYADGQLLIGKTDTTLAKATLTAGEGIDITNGDGTITILGEDASTTNKGISELTIASEIDTGTDDTRAITPASLEGSKYGGTLKRTILFEWGDGATVIASGVQKWVRVPFDCTITSWDLTADQSGSIIVDIWKDTYANFPPTVADTITASAKPTLASVQKNTDSTLSGWTTTVTAGDYLLFNIDPTPVSVTNITLALQVTITGA